MTLAERTCSYQAERTFAHIREIAMLLADGDAVLHGARWDSFGLPPVSRHSDVGHADRLLWIDAMAALNEMQQDDLLTVHVLRARLESAAMIAAGEFTSWRRFMPASLLAEHHCLYQRYDAGRERLYHALKGVKGMGYRCSCELDRAVKAEIVRQYRREA